MVIRHCCLLFVPADVMKGMIKVVVTVLLWTGASAVVRNSENEELEGSTLISPGFRVRVTQAGLELARDVAVDLMMDELNSLRIPDVSESMPVGDVTMSNIRVTSFPRPEAQLSLVEGLGLRWTASDLNPVLEADYELRIKKWVISITKRGTVRATGRHMFFNVEFYIGRDSGGRPTAYDVTCNSGGDISLRFSGQWSDALNAGSSVFRGPITNLVRSQLCAAARNEIEQKMNAELRSFPVTVPIDDVYILDYSLTQFPSFQTMYLDSYHKGAIYLENFPEEPPFVPPSIPPFTEHTQKMVYFYVTDYLINSGLYAAFRAGELSATVTKDVDWVSPEAASFFEVETQATAHAPYLRTFCPEDICVGTVFPGLAEQFPNGMVEVDLFATSSPHVDITGGNTLKLTADGQIDVSVRHTPYNASDSRLEPAFSINMTVEATARIDVNSTGLFFHVLHAEPKADVLESHVGDVGNGFFFEALCRLGVQLKLLPKLNELGAAGIAIPTLRDIRLQGMQLMSIQEQGVVVIGTDVEYIA